jgi:hypothetical protein
MQTAGLEALLRTRTARTWIAVQVGAYIDWVVEHPDFARFLFAMRHAPAVEVEDAAIGELNRDVHARAAKWIADRVAAGELPDIEPSMRWALVLGPWRHWAGSWLRGATTATPEQAKQLDLDGGVCGATSTSLTCIWCHELASAALRCRSRKRRSVGLAVSSRARSYAVTAASRCPVRARRSARAAWYGW